MDNVLNIGITGAGRIANVHAATLPVPGHPSREVALSLSAAISAASVLLSRRKSGVSGSMASSRTRTRANAACAP